MIGFFLTLFAALLNVVAILVAKTDIRILLSLFFFIINTSLCTAMGYRLWELCDEPSFTEILSKIPIKIVR